MWLRYAMRGYVSDPAEEFDPEAVEVANRTSRNSGAVGKRAIVPRIIEELAQPGDTILDFGAGKAAAHALRLQEEHGLDVTAYDFGDNVFEDLHDPDALSRSYDIVYASNVLNVQSSIPMLAKTVMQIASAVKPGGKFVGNLPAQPRKSDELSASLVAEILGQYFSSVERIGGSKSAPVFLCQK